MICERHVYIIIYDQKYGKKKRSYVAHTAKSIIIKMRQQSSNGTVPAIREGSFCFRSFPSTWRTSSSLLLSLLPSLSVSVRLSDDLMKKKEGKFQQRLQKLHSNERRTTINYTNSRKKKTNSIEKIAQMQYWTNRPQIICNSRHVQKA